MEPVPQTRNRQEHRAGGVTKSQIAKIWACARDLGLDREMLYLLVPRGSISALSHREASELIEHLVQLGAKRTAPARTGLGATGSPATVGQGRRVLGVRPGPSPGARPPLRR